MGLLLAAVGAPLCTSCTSSEDTEPYIPAVEGAKQPAGSGALLSEDDACQRVLEAARAAYGRLGCPPPSFEACPSYLRPGGGSGCYEYFEDSVSACEKSYESARSCSLLAPCIVSARRNDELPTCELPGTGAGGQGGATGIGGAASGGETAAQGGAPATAEAGAPATGGASDTPALAGAGGG